MKDGFYAFGREAGAHRKAGTLYITGTTAVTVLGLQKSQYGLAYYVNWGLAFPAHMSERWPRDTACPMRGRLGSLFPDSADRLQQLTNVEAEPAGADPGSELKRMLRELVIPFAEAADDLTWLAQQMEAGRFRGAVVTPSARELLGVSNAG